jgi:hypothetical protein
MTGVRCALQCSYGCGAGCLVERWQLVEVVVLAEQLGQEEVRKRQINLSASCNMEQRSCNTAQQVAT